MASRVLTKRTVYLPNLRAAVAQIRKFSWHRDGENMDSYKMVRDADAETFTVWPDKKLGPFGPKDKRFPLPGHVGHTIKPPAPVVLSVTPTENVDPEAIFDHLPSERYNSVLKQTQEDIETGICINCVTNMSSQSELSDDLKSALPTPEDMLECTVHDCPSIVRKDFADLFPGMNIMHGNFTIITVSQKTKEDMTGWSELVEIEREELLKSFIKGADYICDELIRAGFWADFIDPSSGKPYNGNYTNASLYETDERYRRLGFEIEDLGCCKVIRHHVWGTHAYIGCIFTNAPSTHPVLQILHS